METLKMTKLQTIVGYVWNDNELNDIEKEILDYIEETYSEDYEDAKTWLKDVITFGGISGAIPNLIYHSDVVQFMALHLWTIEDVLIEMESSGWGQYRFVTFDRMCWDVYEHCASHVLFLLENAEDDYIEDDEF